MQTKTSNYEPVSTPQCNGTTIAASENILLVEDDTRLLAILGRMITALGFTSITIESAELALATIT